jgi:molybdenum cofactor synthesis domain-containing protein
MEKTAGIAIIGDEILSGKVGDENARLLIAELRELGVRLRQIAVIPDDAAEIARVVVELSRAFDYVFTSGGVGPTHDDVTMEGIARGFGTRVVRLPELLAQLGEYYGDRLEEAHLRLAEAPEGAELVRHEGPKWPVVRYKNIYILPGVPALFRRKFLSIRELFRETPYALARIYCMAEESALVAALTRTVTEFPAVSFGSYPRFEEAEYRVLITVESKDKGAVRAAVAVLCERFGGVVVKTEEPV